MSLLDDPAFALHCIQVITGAAISLSSLELLSLWSEFGPRGLFTSAGHAARLFRVLICIRLALGLLFASLTISGLVSVFLLLLLTITTLVSNRMLTFGLEAADQMISILLFAQLIASLAPSNIAVQKTCLWFIALQASLAYAVAGWAKVMKPTWRNGSYLRGMLNTELFGHPGMARLLSRGNLAHSLSLALISMESSFPLALVTGRNGCVLFVSCMLVMHVVNGFVLGLNLFIPAFLATYPALLYCASSLRR